MSRNFLRRNEEKLTHGVELVATYLGARDDAELSEVFNLEDKQEERKFYNLDTLLTVLRYWSRNDDERANLLGGFAKMIAFDALVGAQDRHAANWGIIESVIDAARPRRFAPLFDTARGLFWNYPDSQLAGFDAEDAREVEIEKYAERSRPVFGCTETDAGSDINHFRLFEYLLRRGDETTTQPALAVVQAFRATEVRQMLNRKFRRIITPVRMAYIVRLLEVRHARLVAIVRNSGGK